MNILLVCLIITAAIVYIWDYVMFPQELANEVADIITGGKIKHVKLRKPWSCSLCLSTYTTLFILLYFNWKYAPLCLVYGWATQYILAIFQIVDGVLSKILGWMQRITR